MIALTNQLPELVSHWQIPILHHPFRAEWVSLGGRHTAMKSAETISSSAGKIRQMTFLAYPTFSSHAKRILPFIVIISRAKSNAHGSTYLIRESQYVVVK